MFIKLFQVQVDFKVETGYMTCHTLQLVQLNKLVLAMFISVAKQHHKRDNRSIQIDIQIDILFR